MSREVWDTAGRWDGKGRWWRAAGFHAGSWRAQWRCVWCDSDVCAAIGLLSHRVIVLISLVVAKSACDHLMLFPCLWGLWLGWDGEQHMSLSVGTELRESGCFHRRNFVNGRNISISQMLFSPLLRKNLNEKSVQGAVTEAIKDGVSWELSEKGLNRLESTMRAGYFLFSIIDKYTERPD